MRVEKWRQTGPKESVVGPGYRPEPEPLIVIGMGFHIGGKNQGRHRVAMTRDPSSAYSALYENVVDPRSRLIWKSYPGSEFLVKRGESIHLVTDAGQFADAFLEIGGISVCITANHHFPDTT